jgi:hypothetical protein
MIDFEFLGAAGVAPFLEFYQFSGVFFIPQPRPESKSNFWACLQKKTAVHEGKM